ncbi:MAG: ribonuclease H family protein [Jatrophihabitantaceae bacterium]
MRLVVASDGSCLVNPGGPGGWACATSPDSWLAGGHPATTNNLMELRAVYEALAAIPADRPLTIETDSLYVLKSCTLWLDGWKRNGWRTSARKPVSNRSAIMAIDALLAGRDVQWRHVKGHAGHVLNEVCDLRAGDAAAAIRAGQPVAVGPGLAV